MPKENTGITFKEYLKKILNIEVFIFLVISIIVVSIPKLYLNHKLEDRFAFPLMYFFLGLQQIYMGTILLKKIFWPIRLLFIVFGSISIIFVLTKVLPHYYFN